MVCFLHYLDKRVVLLPKCHPQQRSPLNLQMPTERGQGKRRKDPGEQAEGLGQGKTSTSTRLKLYQLWPALACNKLGGLGCNWQRRVASTSNPRVKPRVLPNFAELSHPSSAVAGVLHVHRHHYLCWLFRLTEDGNNLHV